MAIGSDHGGGEHVAATLRGVVFIIVVGLALGTLHNSIGRASRPPRGLPWVTSADEVISLEALSRDGVAVTPTTGAGTSDTSAATTPPIAEPAPVAAPPARTAAPAPAAPSPVAPATPPASPTPVTPAGALPVIPDVDRPIKLELALLKKLHDAGALLVVDAREPGEFAAGHIAGAMNLPYNDALAEPERLRRLGEAGRPIAVYCSGGTCELSMDLAKLMIEHGRRKVLVYEGGYPEWEQAGYPVARGISPGGR